MFYAAFTTISAQFFTFSDFARTRRPFFTATKQYFKYESHDSCQTRKQVNKQICASLNFTTIHAQTNQFPVKYYKTCVNLLCRKEPTRKMPDFYVISVDSDTSLEEKLLLDETVIGRKFLSFNVSLFLSAYRFSKRILPLISFLLCSAPTKGSPEHMAF